LGVRLIQYVKGVGPQLATLFSKLEIYTEEDLLYYAPATYQDRRQMPKICHFNVNTTVLFLGQVDVVTPIQKTRRAAPILEAVLSDDTGQIKCVWFNQLYLKKVLQQGRYFILKGKVAWNTYTNEMQVRVSDTEWIKDITQSEQQGIVPIYGLTSGLYQSTLRKIIQSLLNVDLQAFDVIPRHYLEKYQLMGLPEAIKNVHHPSDMTLIVKARERLTFEEFFYYQLQLVQHRTLFKQKSVSHALVIDGPLLMQYQSNLPYSFTGAQQRTVTETLSDLSQPVAMNRLIQGDVGSGKTDIAMIALLCAVDTQLKGVIMAPTELLAVQHYLKFTERFSHLGVKIYLLKSKMPQKEKRRIIEQINGEDACIIVGTHALLEDPVVLPNVGVCIIDEQHRFGVMQRLKLHLKSTVYPHCLFMTATPIPRTFMLTCFGDLDKSIIDELPPGRKPIKTYFSKPNNLEKVYQFCRTKLKEGDQVYMVYPLVDRSEKLILQSAIESYSTIQDIFSEYRVGLLHGRMTPDEKCAVMTQFKEGKYHILVSTTVIEVGIDVANATIMVINHAERFGLSQLHQLRGRVGRGSKASSCFLVGRPKTGSGNQRIQSMLMTTDGFKIAEYDLKIRGPGDMLGTRQAGIPPFKVGDIVRDERLMVHAKECAYHIIQKDPKLVLPEHQGLAQCLRAKTILFQTEVLN
jgi:ATP-dependent DNA helicase RecG